ncbi:MAG: sigma-70 family RNA polymerase sigma factor [Lachnospiraceae bacterium]|nr:sigma-70 family RNA polymerase sigma factor [Lachnospiraceae bacterium]MBR6014926.1 sigma-70 family RNA polymerase sigma factor [Bacillota bacterium]
MTPKECERIYNEAYRAVYWTAISLLKKEADAEDVVQDTFVTLLESYDTLQDKTKVVPWLKKICANKCLNRLTRTKTEAVEPEFFDDTEYVSEDFLPESVVESKEKRKIIMDIIDRTLSEDVRRTLILYYFDEMNTKEISEALEIPQGTVLWRLGFARKKIKKEVEKYERETDTKLYSTVLPLLALLFLKEAEMVPLRPMPASLAELSASVNTSVAKAGNTNVSTKLVTETIRKGTGIAMKKIIISFVCVALIGAVSVGIIIHLNRDEEPRKHRKNTETVEQQSTEKGDELQQGKEGGIGNSEEFIGSNDDSIGNSEELIGSKEELPGSNETKVQTVPLSEATSGSYVIFGSYEQDNNAFNGEEDIEWLVLARNGDRIFVVSRFALEYKQYTTVYAHVTWETCTLRKWMNETFLSEAFSMDEQAMIPSVTVSADKNPEYNTDPGNDTTDRVFLLSLSEVYKYLDESTMPCTGTPFYYAQGAYVAQTGLCRWWLRTPGDSPYRTLEVDEYGQTDVRGPHTYIQKLGVRPAMWIDLEP